MSRVCRSLWLVWPAQIDKQHLWVGPQLRKLQFFGHTSDSHAHLEMLLIRSDVKSQCIVDKLIQRLFLTRLRWTIQEIHTILTHFHAIRRHGAWWVKYTASWRHGEGCSHCILQISPVSLRQRFGPCLTGCGTSGLWEAAGGSSASTQQGAFRRIFDFALHQNVETISIGAKSITDIEQWWLIWNFEQGFCENFAGINTYKYITWSFWHHQSEVSRHYQGAFHKVTTAQFWLEHPNNPTWLSHQCRWYGLSKANMKFRWHLWRLDLPCPKMWVKTDSIPTEKKPMSCALLPKDVFFFKLFFWQLA